MPHTLKIIVGLGNPDAKYRRTRHNVGRDFIEAAAESRGVPFRTVRGVDVIELPDVGGVEPAAPVFLAKLPCYMNESGGPLKDLALKANAKPAEILVVVDDFMIPFGEYRLRPKGSSGGHNGLKSIFEHFGTEEVPRLRVGIGPVPAGQDPADFVLKKFLPDEQAKLSDVFLEIEKAAGLLIEKGMEKAMNEVNGK